MDAPFTLPFDVFWAWLGRHPNCILRAGTPEAMLYDDEDLHWTFSTEEDGTLVLQMMRGKHPVGELLLSPDQVTYAQAAPQERDDEHVFELIQETESDRIASYFFVLSHGWQEEEAPAQVH